MTQQLPGFDGDIVDHETDLLRGFVCPECGKPLEMVEIRATREEKIRNPNHCELIAICRACEVGFSKLEWERRVQR